MDDKQRLAQLKASLNALAGLDQDTFVRINEIVQSHSSRHMASSDKPLKVCMFDARSYDIDSFNNVQVQNVEWHFVSASLSENTLMAAVGCQVVCLFVNDRCDKKIIKKLAGLGVELIALRCAGFNNVDLEACQKYGVSVVRVPAYSPYAVAEHTVALMLMLNRNLHRAYMRNRNGQFILDDLVGFDMRGKTIGVIGTGKIGESLIEILLGFGCLILAYDQTPSVRFEDEADVTYCSLDQLLTQSDIITLHVPLVDDTHHIIDDDSIDRMKKGVMLINTGRGGLVDAKALIRGLKTGKIGSAGLDVYEEEAEIFFHDVSSKILEDDVLARLLTFSNVIVTSHQAFLTREALANIAQTTVSSIDEFRQGKRGKALTHFVHL